MNYSIENALFQIKLQSHFIGFPAFSLSFLQPLLDLLLSKTYAAADFYAGDIMIVAPLVDRRDLNLEYLAELFRG